jgi:hypothetical protein
MRSATEMPDQSSSGGVSPARNTLPVMTRRPPVSDVITTAYHNIRSWATARSGASCGCGRKVARRRPTVAGFRGNSRAGADRTASPSSQPEPHCARVARSDLSSSPAPTVAMATTRRQERAARRRAHPSPRAAYASASDPARPRRIANSRSIRYMPVRIRSRHPHVRLGRTGRAWLSAERLELSCVAPSAARATSASTA